MWAVEGWDASTKAFYVIFRVQGTWTGVEEAIRLYRRRVAFYNPEEPQEELWITGPDNIRESYVPSVAAAA